MQFSSAIGTAAGRSGGCKSHRWTRPASPSPPSRRFDVVGTKHHLLFRHPRFVHDDSALLSSSLSALCALLSALSPLSPLRPVSPLLARISACLSRAGRSQQRCGSSHSLRAGWVTVLNSIVLCHPVHRRRHQPSCGLRWPPGCDGGRRAVRGGAESTPGWHSTLLLRTVTPPGSRRVPLTRRAVGRC